MPAFDALARKLTDAELAARIEPILYILATYRQRVAQYSAMFDLLGRDRRRTPELPSPVEPWAISR